MRRLKLYAAVFSVLACFAWPGCSRAPGRRYELTGHVVSVDKQAAQVTIAHQAIPGYMTAMTMPFNVKDRWALDVLQPGSTVQATLVVTTDRSWLEDMAITKPAKGGAPAPGAMSAPEAGAEVPGFTLVNQDGRKINLADYKGRAVVLTFIYTRCPLPDFCPLMNSNFQKLDAMLFQQHPLYEQTRLLTISFDPEHDTPKVLREFGSHYAGQAGNDGFAHWDFATGSQFEIKNMAMFFGFNYWPESGQIVHSLSTAVLRPDGRLDRIYRSNTWKPEEILDELRALLPQ